MFDMFGSFDPFQMLGASAQQMADAGIPPPQLPPPPTSPPVTATGGVPGVVPQTASAPGLGTAAAFDPFAPTTALGPGTQNEWSASGAAPMTPSLGAATSSDVSPRPEPIASSTSLPATTPGTTKPTSTDRMVQALRGVVAPKPQEPLRIGAPSVAAPKAMDSQIAALMQLLNSAGASRPGPTLGSVFGR